MSGSGDADDLAAQLAARKTWFYECQVRGLNVDAFRGLSEAFPDPRLDLISEQQMTWDPLGRPIGGRLVSSGRVYLGTSEPVWTMDERMRRDAFGASFVGRSTHFLGYRDGRLIADRLRELRQKYEASTFKSRFDLDEGVNRYPRRPVAGERLGVALARAALAKASPWLLPELYAAKEDAQSAADWLANLEEFLADYESELIIVSGAIPGTEIPATYTDDLDTYRRWLRLLLDAQLTRDAADAVQFRILTMGPAPGDPAKQIFRHEPQVRVGGRDWTPLKDFKGCRRLVYWAEVMHGALGEVYVNKANADMGLCQVLRAVYLHGALPANLGKDGDLTWRPATAPTGRFAEFMARQQEHPDLKGDAALVERHRRASAKLQVILEETGRNPRYPSPHFSPLAQQLARHAIHSFKFWLDEALRCSSNELLCRARKESEIVGNEKEQKSEMEYWSENHYIMFASSEHLAGQLWAGDVFQPAKEFLPAGSKDGILKGSERRDRGRARVLKWLNNKLQFGWTEFNASGYYREHLWAVLNLADFSLDPEVRKKAAVVADLLLFDVARYQHRGAIGPAGGRSQFKSKASGYDNAVADVAEMMFGTHGLFADADSEIGSSFATSSYRVPEVLMEIGIHPPSEDVDRSRVSVSFDEAPKYGIGYSQKSEQKNSFLDGYAAKRSRYFPHLGAINDDIARTHLGYGSTEDDAIFWWGASAYYNKQVVRETMKMVRKFGLGESPIFKGALPTIVKVVEIAENGTAGGLLGTAAGIALGVGGVLGAGVGTALGVADAVFFDPDDLEEASDSLSVLLEGSTRTRANILTYRSPDIMLSSLQNFRAGQLNFQSSACQVAVHAGLNVFTTAGFADLDLSTLEVGGVAGLLGAALVPGAGALAFGLGALVNKAVLTNQGILVDHEDGPGWWTGSWSLPRVVQHRTAAILAYDFHFIQKRLADCGTHAWFPKDGFDEVEERRTGAYEDANFPLLDIGHIGPKGYWVFGRSNHGTDPDTGEPCEGYVGVFSNQRPEWLDHSSDFYKVQLEKVSTDVIDSAEDKIDDIVDDMEDDDRFGDSADDVRRVVKAAVSASYRPDFPPDAWVRDAKAAVAANTNPAVKALICKANELVDQEVALRTTRRVWADPLPRDYFAGRDWYAGGKNVWIIQVGSRAEFGDFETFKQRVSSARVRIDDSGDLECSYDIPRQDGSSDRLSLAYGDGGRFQLNGAPLEVDRFPRFENRLVRGGRVEWGQREYVIEWNGKSLLHDFSDFANPIRTESPATGEDDADVVRALVLYVVTGDEEMKAFSVATVTATVGCSVVTTDQVAACGPADEGQVHEAEWIFLDAAAPRDPDMSMVLTHPGTSDGEPEPSWKMSFALKALMGDRRLVDCSLSQRACSFEGRRRTSAAMPFSVALHRWRPWQRIDRSIPPRRWTLAATPPASDVYIDRKDLLVIDSDHRLWHRELRSSLYCERGWQTVGAPRNGAPDLSQAHSMTAICTAGGDLSIFVAQGGRLQVCTRLGSGTWDDVWHTVEVWRYASGLLGLPDVAAPPVSVGLHPDHPVVGVHPKGAVGRLDLYALGADGHFYLRTGWQLGANEPWARIKVSGFVVGRHWAVAGDRIFAIDGVGRLWSTLIEPAGWLSAPSWTPINAPVPVDRFAVHAGSGLARIAIADAQGSLHVGSWSVAGLSWTAIVAPSPTVSGMSWSAPDDDSAWLFAIGVDRVLYGARWVAGNDQPAAPWSVAGRGFPSVSLDPAGGLATMCRVVGQVEVLVLAEDRSLAETWWS